MYFTCSNNTKQRPIKINFDEISFSRRLYDYIYLYFVNHYYRNMKLESHN